MGTKHRPLGASIWLAFVWLGLAAAAGCPAPSEAAPSVRSTIASGPWQMPQRALCEGNYGVIPSQAGRLTSDMLAEVSGLVASPSQAGVIWANNDSGDDAHIYALDAAANVLATVELMGVDAVDFEDVAASACPDGSGPCLWVADVGDNDRARNDAIVYAIPEPQIAGGSSSESPKKLISNEGWRFPVKYPDGAVNVEALVVHPDGSAFYLFEKSSNIEARLYRTPSPLVDDVLLTLEEMTKFSSPGIDVEHGRKITGADLHPSGRALLLRVYTGVYEYALSDVDDLHRLAEISPGLVALGPFAEPQGEAVAYDDSGRGIWTMSEDPEGKGHQPLHHFPCQ